MEWFSYVRENIFVGIIVASILSSVAVAFFNLTEKGQNVDNTKLSIIFAVIFGIAVTKFDLDWTVFASYQDTVIRLGVTIIIPWLVAKLKGQEVVDSIVAKVVDGAKNINIGKKDSQ